MLAGAGLVEGDRLRDRAARRLRPARPLRPRRHRRVPRLQEQRAGPARARRAAVRAVRPDRVRRARLVRRDLHHAASSPTQHPTAAQDFLRATMRGLADAIADPGRGDADGDRPRRGQRQPQLPVARGRVVPLAHRRRAAQRPRRPTAPASASPTPTGCRPSSTPTPRSACSAATPPTSRRSSTSTPIAGVYDGTQVIWPRDRLAPRRLVARLSRCAWRRPVSGRTLG